MLASFCFFDAKRPAEPLHQKYEKILHRKTAMQDFKIRIFTDVTSSLRRR